MTPEDRGDRGSASIWVLACSALVLLIGVATSLRTAAVLARHRAESAADFAALAAASQIGVGGDGCTAAAALAAANGAALVRCRADIAPDGRSGTVDVSVSLAVALPVLGAQRVTATARAGRLTVAAMCDGADACPPPAAQRHRPAESASPHAG